MELYKDKIGQIFFALSILMLIYMLLSPLTQVIGNVGEYFTLTVIHFPVSDIIHISGGDVNPPLYYLLLKVVSRISSDLTILKLFSVIPYALLITVSTVKIRKDYNWFTAGLFIFSMALMSEFFTNFLLLRPYGWATLFTIMAFLYLKDLLSDEIDLRSVIFFSIYCVLASYCHYFAIFTSICLYMAFLVYRVRYCDDEHKYFLIALAIGIILYLPWISTAFTILGSVNGLATLDIIQSLTYFAYTGNGIIGIISLLIFAAITYIYLKSSAEDKIYVYSGIGAYFGTVIIALIISAFKPIIVGGALLPASGILLLTIAIMISKLEDKMFLIALALMIILLISGFAASIASADSLYQDGLKQKEVFDSISQDSDSSIIIDSPGAIMYFLYYSNSIDTYALDLDYVYGENMNRTHKLFNFEDINHNDIKSFATKNPDKNIYLINWGKPDIDIGTSEIFSNDKFVISKINNG